MTRYHEIISTINKELEEFHKRAARRVSGLLAKTEEQKQEETRKLEALNERYRRLEKVLPALNNEILNLTDLNKESLLKKKDNERKQIELKKIIEDRQKQLNSLINAHTHLVEEMHDRNIKENELVKRTERILFFKKQLLFIMRKTQGEIERAEKDITLLNKESAVLHKGNMPNLAALPEKGEIVSDNPTVRIIKRKDSVRIIKGDDTSPKVNIRKSGLKFNPKKGIKVNIKVK